MTPKNCPHCGGKLDDDKIVTWGGWSFDEMKNQFVPGTPGCEIRFTFLEGQVIGVMLRAAGRTVSKDGGLYSVFCSKHNEDNWPDIKIVDTYVCKVRKKMQDANLMLIETIWGRGYAAVTYVENPAFAYKFTKPSKERVIPKDKAHNNKFNKHTVRCGDCGHIQSHHKTVGGGQYKKIKECQVQDCGCSQFRKV